MESLRLMPTSRRRSYQSRCVESILPQMFALASFAEAAQWFGCTRGHCLEANYTLSTHVCFKTSTHGRPSARDVPTPVPSRSFP
eukprot:1352939-Pleurochrysis_carterae.AAC.1